MKSDETANISRRQMVLIILSVVLCSFVTRAGVMAVNFGDRSVMMDGDGEDYYDIATNLYSGFGFSQTVYPKDGSRAFTQATARRPPLYPLFACAAFYAGQLVGWGGVPFPVIVLQVFLDCATAALVCLMARQLAGWKAGCVAGLAYALNLQLARFPAQFMSETLFTFLQTAGLLLFIRGVVLVHRDDRDNAAPTYLNNLLCFGGSGVMLGLATLTRPVILLLPAVLAGWTLVRYRNDFRQVLPKICAFLMVFAITLIPWMSRNKSQLGKLIVVSTVGGQTFFHSNHITSNGLWVPLDIPEGASDLTEPELDAFYYRKGLAFIVSHPFLSLKNSVKKVLRLYYAFYPEYDWYYGFSLCLIIPGVWIWWKESRRTKVGDSRHDAMPGFWVLVVLVLYTTLMSAVFWGQPRFRAPLMPALLCFAGVYVASIHSDTKKHAIWIAVAFAANVLIALAAEPLRAAVQAIVR